MDKSACLATLVEDFAALKLGATRGDTASGERLDAVFASPSRAAVEGVDERTARRDGAERPPTGNALPAQLADAGEALCRVRRSRHRPRMDDGVATSVGAQEICDAARLAEIPLSIASRDGAARYRPRRMRLREALSRVNRHETTRPATLHTETCIMKRGKAE